MATCNCVSIELLNTQLTQLGQANMAGDKRALYLKLFSGEMFKGFQNNTIARDLENAGLANGSRIFAADLFSFFHLYGDFKPLIHGAPWYYGGLPGYQSADYLLLPICPIAQDIQQMILTDITEAGDEDKWTEVGRTPVYVLYAKEG